MNSRPRKTCFSTPRAQVSLPCHALLGSNYLFSVRFVYAERFPELRSTNSDSRVEQPTRVKQLPCCSTGIPIPVRWECFIHMKKGSSLLSVGESRFSTPSFIFHFGHLLFRRVSSGRGWPSSRGIINQTDEQMPSIFSWTWCLAWWGVITRGGMSFSSTDLARLWAFCMI